MIGDAENGESLRCASRSSEYRVGVTGKLLVVKIWLGEMSLNGVTSSSLVQSSLSFCAVALEGLCKVENLAFNCSIKVVGLGSISANLTFFLDSGVAGSPNKSSSRRDDKLERLLLVGVSRGLPCKVVLSHS